MNVRERLSNMQQRLNRALRQGSASRLAILVAVTLLLAGIGPFLGPSTASAQNVDISLTKAVCETGFDDSGLGLLDLQNSCQTPGAGIPFAIVPDGGTPIDTSADGSGIVVATGLTAGSGYITETAAEMSYSRVFCVVYATGDPLPDVSSYIEYAASSNAIGWTLNDNESLDCFWFNIPESSGDLSTINVFTYACPAEFDVTGKMYNDLVGACTSSIADVEFYLYPSDASEVAGLTDASGFVMFENVPSGSLNLVEVPPTGYQPAAVFCASAPMGSGESPDPEPVNLIDGAMIEYDLGAAYYLSCFWFNVQADTPSTVQLTKYSCPENYDWTGASLDQLYANCVNPQAGVEFLIGGPATTLIQTTDDNGQAIWTLDPGDYQLSETLPSGYIATRAFCGLNLEHGGGVAEMPLSQSAFAISLPQAGDVLDCVVFNLAGEIDPGPSSLTIDKYTCPAGFDVLAEGANPQAECTLGTDDIIFDLRGENAQLSASTGTGGAPATVKFSDLEPGTYLLTEQTPEPIDMAFILSCSSDVRTFNYPFAPFAVIEAGGRLVVDLRPGEDMTCSWYNVLADQPGTVTITKYWCDGEAGSLTNCQPYGGGIAFLLIPVDGGDAISLQTGDDGTGTVEATGAFEVEEQGFTWCAAQSDFVDGNGNLLVEAGTDVTVEIYNCGPRPLQ